MLKRATLETLRNQVLLPTFRTSISSMIKLHLKKIQKYNFDTQLNLKKRN